MTRTARQMLAIGPLSNGSRNQPHYIANGHTFATPDRVCNSLQPTMTTDEARRLTAAPPVRPGADAFRQFKSRGQGC